MGGCDPMAGCDPMGVCDPMGGCDRGLWYMPELGYDPNPKLPGHISSLRMRSVTAYTIVVGQGRISPCCCLVPKVCHFMVPNRTYNCM